MRWDSDFAARMVFRDARGTLGIGRSVDCIFGIGFLRENRIGIRCLRPLPGKEADIFERPAVWRVCHSDLEMLSEAVGEKTNPPLSFGIVTHERLGRNGRLIASGILRWKVPDLSEPKISQGL